MYMRQFEITSYVPDVYPVTQSVLAETFDMRWNPDTDRLIDIQFKSGDTVVAELYRDTALGRVEIFEIVEDERRLVVID